MKKYLGSLAAVLVLHSAVVPEARAGKYDVVVYGATVAGIGAAIEAAEAGKSVVILEPSDHVGGLTTSGLGATDFGNPQSITGMAKDFYGRVYQYYQSPEVWKEETRDEYVHKHEDAVFEKFKMQFFFEPSVAAKILDDMLTEARVPVRTQARLKRPGGAEVKDRRIQSITLESGEKIEGSVFIDATYEGDLMAEAGVSYFVGREPASEFGESVAGVRTLTFEKTGRQSAYKVEGDPSSGLLPGVLPQSPGQEGDGDNRIQAYNYRVCLTDADVNKEPIAKPESYDRDWYEAVARLLRWRPKQMPGTHLIKLTPMPNHKTDSNNQGPFSTDFVGQNYEWPSASYAEREVMAKRHRDYILGFIWFLQNDEAVPEPIRTEMKRWGLPKDEFASTGHFPPQIYVREARRMRGEYVVTENDSAGSTVEDGIAFASYPLDSHQVSRYADEDGILRLEGAFWKKTPPFPVSYRAIVPKRAECENLLVPICLSSTHAAYGSIRMEPVFMALGQAAGVAAALSIDAGQPVQDAPVETIREKVK